VKRAEERSTSSGKITQSPPASHRTLSRVRSRFSVIARIATRSFGTCTSPLRGSRTILTRVVVYTSILQVRHDCANRRHKSRSAIRDAVITERTHFMPRCWLPWTGERIKISTAHCEERVGARCRLRFVVVTRSEKSRSRHSWHSSAIRRPDGRNLSWCPSNRSRDGRMVGT